MSTYEISKSSLLSLKAEILKKQEELNKVKLENKSKTQKEVKKGPLEFKNKGVEFRRGNDVNSDDEDLLRKSKIALEAKSKLYEKLSKGTSDPDQKYLVHFEKKSHQQEKEADKCDHDIDRYPESDVEEYNDYDDYKADNSDEEWVEYTDCFGRTRTCLRKDLQSMKEKDKNLYPNVDKLNECNDDKQHEDEDSNYEEFNEKSEMLSGDMRKELQRQKWEKEENELRDKKNIHYQDVLFSEARTHGVGYYAFSKDDDEREKQQDALNKLRQETKDQQKMAQEVKRNREKQLKARILAAKNRKRARMGLPPLELDEEPEEKPTEIIEEQPKIIEEDEKAVARKRHVRPWDIGKEGVKEHREYSQEEWVELQREKRDKDFAPPRAYNSMTETASELDIQDTNKGLYFSSKKRPFHNDTDVGKPPPIIKKFLNPYKCTPTPIHNECLDEDDDEDDDRLLQDYKDLEEGKRGVSGVEIAPPPTYEYYGPSASKSRKQVPRESSIEDSIMEGLKFLREKIEKKSKR